MAEVKDYSFVIANGDKKEQVIALLQQNELPVTDIDESKIIYALLHDDKVIGTGGLEVFTDCAFLRSISVMKEWQGKGLGKFITSRLEEICREQGIPVAYLLTTAAKDYFIKAGYQVIDRKSAPVSIKNTSEFSTVCSSSAILMKKDL